MFAQEHLERIIHIFFKINLFALSPDEAEYHKEKSKNLKAYKEALKVIRMYFFQHLKKNHHLGYN